MNVVTFSSRSVVSGKPEDKAETARLKRLLREQDERDRNAAALREAQKQATANK